jgi:imidazolonepropionase
MSAAMTDNRIPEALDSLWTGCHLATLREPEDGYGVLKAGALAVKDKKIVWVGPESDLPSGTHQRSRTVKDLGGAWVTPGLIDCHTHLVYAGNRTAEFERRLNGATYEEIARRGGGIMSTVNAVRTADEEDLYMQSVPRLKAMQAEGVTTLEIKSGYGLNQESELKMLRVIDRLGRDFPVTVLPTFLGAHALPPEYRDDPDGYIDLIVEQMLPAVASGGLAVAVDAFCERIGFSPALTERVLAAAVSLGFNVKLHAEQLSDLKGTALAAQYGALSADHLEYLEEDGIAAMARNHVTAVLLPGAFYYLQETQKPPVDLLRAAGVRMAVSTDCNPGSSPCTSPLLMMNMACMLFGLTPVEALRGMTIHAARALGTSDTAGSLEPGKAADFAVWDISEPAELSYGMGGNPCRLVVKDGEIVIRREDPYTTGRGDAVR